MNIAEYYAFSYLDLAENNNLYFIVLVLGGALIGGIFVRVEFKLQRSTFFLYKSVVACIVPLVQLVWLAAAKAMAVGLLPLLVAIDVILWISTGYALIVLGKARAWDAFGRKILGFVIFIPIVNLWLLFSPTKDESEVQSRGFHVGGAAVALGLVLLALGKFVGEILEDSLEYNEFADVSVEDSANIRQKYFIYSFERYGLDHALDYLASLNQAGERQDDITILEDVSVIKGNIVFVNLITDNDIVSIDGDWQNSFQQELCAEYGFAISRGAALIMAYYSEQHGELAEIVVSESTC